MTPATQQNIERLADFVSGEKQPRDGLIPAIWNPYESIEDAWMLVEKMRTDKRILWVEMMMGQTDVAFEMRVDEFVISNYEQTINGAGKSAQHAICEVVLQWLDKEGVNGKNPRQES